MPQHHFISNQVFHFMVTVAINSISDKFHAYCRDEAFK